MWTAACGSPNSHLWKRRFGRLSVRRIRRRGTPLLRAKGLGAFRHSRAVLKSDFKTPAPRLTLARAWFNFNVRLRLIGLRRSWFLRAIREFQLAIGLRIENAGFMLVCAGLSSERDRTSDISICACHGRCGPSAPSSVRGNACRSSLAPGQCQLHYNCWLVGIAIVVRRRPSHAKTEPFVQAKHGDVALPAIRDNAPEILIARIRNLPRLHQPAQADASEFRKDAG